MSPPSDHFDGQRFSNPGRPVSDRTLAELLRWRLLGRRAAWPAAVETPSRSVPERKVEAAAITMIGHSSVLIQTAGCNILVDPVWSERASPLNAIGPRRWNAPGIAFDDLPAIDAVLITHNHYDHLDIATLARLDKAHRPRILAPLGNDALIGRAAPSSRVEVGDWGDRFTLGHGVSVTLHPAIHWSARGLGDRRKALWCGFMVETPSGVIYVAGDTAYGDGGPFRAVLRRFGPPMVAVLPIGAYEPRWFMRDQHVNPDEAVRIMLDCGASHALGVHWGTFQLTDEARMDPVTALDLACVTHGLDRTRFEALRPGDVWLSDARLEAAE